MQSATWFDGDLPQGWDIIPLRGAFEEKTERSGEAQDAYLSLTANAGVIPYAEKGDIGNKAPEDMSKCKRVSPGDFVLNSMNFGIGSFGVSQYEGVCSSVYLVLKPKRQFNKRYLERIFELSSFQKYAQSLGNGILAHRAAFGWDKLRTIQVPLPPRSDQDTIVEFLDRELSLLDHSIEKLSELKNKITEFRRASIIQAVQLGVESNPDTKPGPESYLPKVREDWGFGALKRFVNFGSGSGFPEIDQGIETEEIPFLKVNALGQAAADGLISVRTDTVSRSTAKRLGASVFPAGSLIMAKVGAALLLGRVGVLSEASCVDNNMMVVIPKSDQHPRYYYYMLQTLEFASFVNPGAVPSTSGTVVGRQVVSNVPYEAQKSISEHLDAICGTLDTLSRKIEGSLKLLNERRSALISTAVIGKLELQEAS
jgi:type I restriction enzyme S subunit